MSLYKLDKIANQLRGKDLSSAQVRLFVEKADDGLADLVKRFDSATQVLKVATGLLQRK